MPNWKKVITSGSQAELAGVTGSFLGSFRGDGSGLTGISAGGGGIFATTGSFQSTTNDLQITGSLTVSGSDLDVQGSITASGDLRVQNGTTFLGTGTGNPYDVLINDSLFLQNSSTPQLYFGSTANGFQIKRTGTGIFNVFNSTFYSTGRILTNEITASSYTGSFVGVLNGAVTGNQEITGRRPIVSDTNTTINLTLGTHEGVFLYSDNASTVTVNVPTNASQAFPVGTEIDIIQAGAGTVGLVPAQGVNLNGANTGIPITAQWGAVTIKQIVTDNWIVVGRI